MQKFIRLWMRLWTRFHPPLIYLQAAWGRTMKVRFWPMEEAVMAILLTVMIPTFIRFWMSQKSTSLLIKPEILLKDNTKKQSQSLNNQILSHPSLQRTSLMPSRKRRKKERWINEKTRNLSSLPTFLIRWGKKISKSKVSNLQIYSMRWEENRSFPITIRILLHNLMSRIYSKPSDKRKKKKKAKY
jgi:hypothetical protein